MRRSSRRPIAWRWASWTRRPASSSSPTGAAADPALRALAAKISYEVDPNDEYPRNFTGTLIATLKDGRVLEFRKGHMRGGAREPLTDEELSAKFLANAAFGGMAADEARRLEAALLAPLRQAAS